MNALLSIKVKAPSTQAIMTYLYIMGTLATLAIAFAILMLVAYLLQCLLLTIGEACAIFASLDPFVRTLILLFSMLLVTAKVGYSFKVRGF